MVPQLPLPGVTYDTASGSWRTKCRKEAIAKFSYKGYRKWVLTMSELCWFLVRLGSAFFTLKKLYNPGLLICLLNLFPWNDRPGRGKRALKCLDYSVAMETGVRVPWMSSYTGTLHIVFYMDDVLFYMLTNATVSACLINSCEETLPKEPYPLDLARFPRVENSVNWFCYLKFSILQINEYSIRLASLN